VAAGGKQVMRDIQRSGQAAGEVIQQVSDTVFPMYKAFIEPCLRSAHIRVINNFNPFAGFKEPVQILKTDEVVSVEMVMECMRELFTSEEITQVRAAYVCCRDALRHQLYTIQCVLHSGLLQLVMHSLLWSRLAAGSSTRDSGAPGHP
jgi:CxxC motif-containing protein